MNQKADNFKTSEQEAYSNQLGLDAFLTALTRTHVRNDMLDALTRDPYNPENLQKCFTYGSVKPRDAVASLVINTIFSLYDKNSTGVQNAQRITTALELAVFDLMQLRDVIQSLPYQEQPAKHT